MSFIPKKLNIHQAYKYIDNMFGNWFSKSSFTIDNLIFLTPNIINLSSDEILYVMMWHYYNYIIDWLEFRFPKKLGDTGEVRWVNLSQIKCFLEAAKMSNDEIKKTLQNITKGTGLTDEWIEKMMSMNWKPTMETFVKQYPSSPFNNKQILSLFKKRNNSKTMFNLDTDQELLIILNNKISTILATIKAKKAAVKEAIRREALVKEEKLARGHGVVKELIFSQESVEIKNKPILRIKKQVAILTPEQQAAKEKRRIKLLARRAKAIKKAREAEGESSPEEVEFKTYKNKFLY